MRLTIAIAFMAIAIASCSGSSPSDNASDMTTETLQIASTALSGNQTGDSTDRNVLVYLPPSYANSTTSYPVVYYLHGYDGSSREMLSFLPGIDAAMRSGEISEFIMIGVDGRNNLGGSFYVNGTATGLWETHLVSEVVNAVDATYRTLPHSVSRGIAGFSMGGFGAINLGMKHPDVFGAAYALAPGLLRDTDLDEAITIWRNEPSFLTAYGMTFSPDITGTHPQARIPVFDGTTQDNQVIQDWLNGFGHLVEKVNTYISGAGRLNAIRIDYNTGDYYTWIPSGCIEFTGLLQNAGITCSGTAYPGNHGDDMSRIARTSLAQFFADSLTY